jgi:hypothetical protein
MIAKPNLITVQQCDRLDFPAATMGAAIFHNGKTAVQPAIDITQMLGRGGGVADYCGMQNRQRLFVGQKSDRINLFK